MPGSNINTLKLKRDQFVHKLNKFETYYNKVTRSKAEVVETRNRLARVVESFEEFENIQCDLERLNPDEAGENVAIENKYFQLTANAEEFIESFSNVAEPKETASPAIQRLPIKLPTMSLPQFSGSYTEWTSFEDNLQSLFERHSYLSDFDKCHYLKLSVKNDAARLISHLKTTSENYNIAWALLKERYKNNRLIVQNHLTNIFNMQSVNKGSSENIRCLLDTVYSNLLALNSLKLPTESWDTLIIYIVLSKLDYSTKKDWETSWKSKELPALLDLTEFLKHYCNTREAIDFQSNSKPSHSNSSNSNSSNCKLPDRRLQNVKSVNHLTNNVSKLNCVFCKSPAHSIFRCTEFLKLDVDQRVEDITKLSLCTNCLKVNNHNVTTCFVKHNFCRVCNKSHHTLLHKDNQSVTKQKSPSVQPITSNYQSDQTSSIVTNTSSAVSNVILSTAVVHVNNNENQLVKLRALLDCGSQSSYITEAACEKLNVSTGNYKPVNISIQGINGKVSQTSKTLKINVLSRFSTFSKEVECLVLPNITKRLPLRYIPQGNLEIPRNINLADPLFYKPSDVDLLLGNDIFWELVTVGQLKLDNHKLIVQNTHLGYIVAGEFVDKGIIQKTMCNISVVQLDKALSKFFEMEQYPEVGVKHLLSKEQNSCEAHFAATHKRLADGRFQLHLPFKNEQVALGSSFELACKRFYNLENKLNKNPELKQEYSNFLKEYESLNHMELVQSTDDVNNDHNHYYLPHHCVLKESSTTTKLRVVFDASAATTNNLSLNDNLMVGPTLQPELITILLNFRLFTYVLSADIEKMYRQIWIDPIHQNYQRIIWRDNPEDNLKIYKLKTVTYGTSSAPYQAIKCLMQLADDQAQKYPLASKTIKSSFYVDDLLVGSDSVVEALQIKAQTIECLRQAKFPLHKWISNSKILVSHQDNVKAERYVNVDKQTENKTLGLMWDSEKDLLSYRIQIDTAKRCAATKRLMLSKIAQIYDPLGLVGCVVVKAKLFLQKLWKLKLGWDEPVPQLILNEWNEFYEDCPNLNKIQFPRLVLKEYCEIIEIHAFADASERAYGTVIYLKSYKGHKACVRLLCAKSRVAPIKFLTIPRLELTAVSLMANLVNKLLKTLNKPICKSYFWTDSTIVLSWLSADPSQLKTYVANRTSEIVSLIDINNFYHVKGNSNPADLISRGLSPSELHSSILWFNGPSWLSHENVSCWSNQHISNFCSLSNLENLPEVKFTTNLATNDQSNKFEILTRYSKFSKLQRVIAYCYRFIHNCINKGKIKDELGVKELREAKVCILKLLQGEAFSSEFKELKGDHKKVNSKSTLLTLNPFLDKSDLIRVGGRLKKAVISETQRFPIVLPKGHHVTKMLIRDAHERTLHAGQQGTLAYLRLEYWPLAARSMVRQTIQKCITCYKFNAQTYNPIMGNLPKDRLQPTRPFLYCGLDYAGPINIRQGKSRGRYASKKAYIALFVCMATKAIHLELVSELTTEAFLQALKRMIARRGNIAKLFSDNATNFVAASRVLVDVDWCFIPPRSPHMGGLWEINIKCVKSHLKRIIGDAHLTFEEMYTILTSIEAILNSRPLMALSNDPNDLMYLSPGHFLIGEPLNAPVDPDVTNINVHRLSRWQHIDQMRQHFWRRWSQEYLSHLQQRTKWKVTNSKVPEVGALVLMKEDNTNPLQWKVGRITEIFPGTDEVVRVVSVKCSNQKVYKRAVHKLCPLPINSS